FSVQRGASSITSVTPTIAGQNQTLKFTLTGQGTHWLQGGTTADFGAGIVVNQLTITDATHASGQITVLSNAPLGLRALTMATDCEYATREQGIDVQQRTPALISSSPRTARQGAVFQMQIQGRFTHFVQGVTNAGLGTGVVFQSFSVTDSVSG